MANICSNNFYISYDNMEIREQLENKLCKLLEEKLYGEISYTDEGVIEGYFDSKWSFPDYLFNHFFDEFADDSIYMRCLSEEYGMGLVSMNIYSDCHWRNPQYFDL